jgi:hypothetical protein
MDGRNLARILLAVVVLGGLALLGSSLYQAGFANGLAANIAADPQLAGQAVAPYYAYGYPGWHGGWGFGGIFGILGFILFLFLIFALIRFAVGGGRRWGGGPGWGGGYRGGWGGPKGDYAAGFRGSPFEERAREVHDEWHRRASQPADAQEGTDRPGGGTTNA